MNHQLAIVISAYKSAFLKNTLESIASQTDQRFNLYVCDDASPEPILEIVSGVFPDFNRIHYVRFESNLGGQSLAKQYERCINLCEESWIWLFSDDDMMEAHCVAEFYSALEKTGERFDLYRFNSVTIDKEGCTIGLNPPHPECEPWYEFAYFFLKNLRKANQQEQVIRRAKFLELGGFLDFPMAWWSDIAFAISCGTSHGYWTIQNARILFRASELNISSLKDDKIYKLKLEALFDFNVWLARHIIENECGRFPGRKLLLNIAARYFVEKLRRRRAWLSVSDIKRAISILTINYEYESSRSLMFVLLCNILIVHDKFLGYARRFFYI